MDPYFHYYGTYLAALTMGVQPHAAQELAYYTYCAADQTAGNVPSPLFYEDYRFNPVLTADGQSELGKYCCNLAFQSLPAFCDAGTDETEVAVARPMPLSKQQLNSHKPKVVCQGNKVTRCYYNPLTDIDWQHGGEFKRHFSERLQKKAYFHSAELSHAMTGENDSEFKTAENKGDESAMLFSPSTPDEPLELPTQLLCSVDSAFARKMLNDVIYKSHYDNQTKGISWPLFGCRLYVYQNTWQGEGDIAQAHISAFIATCYAIQSWVKRIPLKHCGYWVQGMMPSSVRQAVAQLECLLYSHHGYEDYRGIGDDWARLIAQHLPHGEAPHLYGIALRPAHLYEQALISGAVRSGEYITDLTGFKRSAWFKYNKAAEYHCDWLARQFCHYELSAFNTRQTLGNLDMWR
ncbi:hypothetical protein N474_21050 [Pseudoalteromonas luteoviolacea CPMOR-2]|uniref:hypothetical protein n=1 Tax=Pseudoalteromonas luteoviolacea TaxID=43657 RepID=UPI0007B07917|nr:hypothetical protein [Pseudoalteromonas luteoviolacea]KZN53550.1 hypothetical protein N474_21050 [Pseudoalteromonas luteoviolacea CPMOR-2]